MPRVLKDHIDRNLLLTRSELDKVIQDMIDDETYKLSRARSPKSRRHSQSALQFWRSMQFHLRKEVAHG